jgi:UDPglucose 6-dehydrogenase
LKQPVIFDGRNIYDPRDLAAQGFLHEGIGRRAAAEPGKPGKGVAEGV